MKKSTGALPPQTFNIMLFMLTTIQFCFCHTLNAMRGKVYCANEIIVKVKLSSSRLQFLFYSVSWSRLKILKKRRGDNLLQANKSHFHLKDFFVQHNSLLHLNKFLEINCAEITIEKSGGGRSFRSESFIILNFLHALMQFFYSLH